MGIKGLNEFLKKKHPDCFRTIKLNEFRGYRIAIDMGNWIYTYFPIVIKDYMKKKDHTSEINFKELEKIMVIAFIDFIIRITASGLYPICVFDGKSSQLKAKTQKKRRDTRPKERLEELTEKLKDMNILEVDKKDLETYRNLICRCTFVPYETILSIEEHIEMLGIPVINAEYEAEHTACSLIHSDHADVIWSRDSDTFAMGAPIVINKIYPNNDTEIVLTNVILESLEMTQIQFREFCIMLGCDFNENIPNYGPVKVYKLFKEHKRYKNISEKLDTSVINMEEVYEMFEPVYIKRIDSLDLNCLEENESKLLEFMGRERYSKLKSRLKDIQQYKHYSRGVKRN